MQGETLCFPLLFLRGESMRDLRIKILDYSNNKQIIDINDLSDEELEDIELTLLACLELIIKLMER